MLEERLVGFLGRTVHDGWMRLESLCPNRRFGPSATCGYFLEPVSCSQFFPLGWPQFHSEIGDSAAVVCRPPCRKDAHVPQRHTPMKGVSADGDFRSQSPIGMDAMFWKLCFNEIEAADFHWEGCSLWPTVSVSSSQLPLLGIPSLSSAISSLDPLFQEWKNSGLSLGEPFESSWGRKTQDRIFHAL